jgi:hypothetical protein
MLSIFVLSSFVSLLIMFFFSLWCLYSAAMVSFISFFCFYKFSILVVLEFLEGLLYILVDHIQYPLYEILIEYL